MPIRLETGAGFDEVAAAWALSRLDRGAVLWCAGPPQRHVLDFLRAQGRAWPPRGWRVGVSPRPAREISIRDRWPRGEDAVSLTARVLRAGKDRARAWAPWEATLYALAIYEATAGLEPARTRPLDLEILGRLWYRVRAEDLARYAFRAQLRGAARPLFQLDGRVPVAQALRQLEARGARWAQVNAGGRKLWAHAPVLERARALGLGGLPLREMAVPVRRLPDGRGEGEGLRGALARGHSGPWIANARAGTALFLEDLADRLGAVYGRREGEDARAFLQRLPNRARAGWSLACRTADRLGLRVFLVGGAVRDALLGRPVGDLDLAVEGDPARFVRELARALKTKATVHDRFGTATLPLPGGLRLDVARTRAETYPTAGSLPQVQPAGILEDLRRRDFTVHALAVEHAGGGRLRWLDPCGGFDDLARKQLRALHPLSFLDDPTRALRAVRYGLRLGFRIERSTAAWIALAVEHRAFDAVSAERLRRELRLLFEECGIARGLRALAARRLLEPLGVRLDAQRSRELGRLAGRAERAARKLGAYQGPEAWKLALACLALVAPPERRQRWGARLGTDRRTHALWHEGPARARRLSRRLGSLAAARPSRIVELCGSASRGEQLLAFALGPEAARRWLRRFWQRWEGVEPDVRGTDLVRAGIPPGPGVAAGLRAALRAKLDGRAPGRQAQLAVALAAARRRA